MAATTHAQIQINELFADNETHAYADGSISDWVELVNTSDQTVNLGGYSLSDTTDTPRKWVFPDGVSLGPNAYLVVLLDSSQPVSTTPGEYLNAGFAIKAAGDRLELYGPGAIPPLADSVRFGPQAADFTVGRIPTATGSFTLTSPTPDAANIEQALGSQSTLRINEWMASPGSGEDDWFELYNPDPLPVQLTGLHFRDSGNVPSPVAPLSYIGGGENGYLQFIADNSTEDNEVDFGLSANGDSIGLYRADNSQIDRVQFGEQSEGISEGRMPDGSASIRSLTVATPGNSNLVLYEGLVVNELLSHTDPPYEDAVEFYNSTDSAINIGGWYLSDNRNDLARYRIPDNTIVPARGYYVIYENQFDGPTATTPFTFDAANGEQVHLSQVLNGNLTGYIVQESFEAAENGVSFGRVTTSVPGDYKFVALETPTFGMSNPTSVEQFRTGTGQENSGPRVGPVVINEIMYNPLSPDGGITDNTLDEYVELVNITGQNVLFYDALHPENRWRLQGDVEFSFPANTLLSPSEVVLVVSFDPATNPSALTSFRTKFNVPASVRVFGPYIGKLGNGGDEVELYKPDAPQPPGRPDAGFVPYIRVDKVNYSDAAPWPSAADGTGQSLHRKAVAEFGNDPANWEAAAPSAGAWEGAVEEVHLTIAFDGGAGPLQIQFSTVAGRSYTVQYKANLQPSTAWQNLTTVTAGNTTHTVEDSVPSVGQRFYRVISP